MGNASSAGGRLYCVVALPAEARPLIDAWSLKRCPESTSLPVYKSVDERRWLVISGVGRVAAAMAVGFLAHLAGVTRSGAWLNVGVAGSAAHPLGSVIIGHKVVDTAVKKSWYPSQLFQGPRLKVCAGAVIYTGDHPISDYPPEGVVDMEASAVCAAALRFSSVELVQCLKVVSDTPERGVNQVTKDHVVGLMQAQLETFDAVADELLVLSDELAGLSQEPPHYSEMLERWRWTTSQSHQLKKLLGRWALVFPGKLPSNGLDELRRSRDVLARLREALDSAPVSLHKKGAL
ncbi:MAG: hypothetical protein VX699_00055 [Myxococcota bacterium]|nr:hypothetical protein [Myxococcota bacterium]